MKVYMHPTRTIWILIIVILNIFSLIFFAIQSSRTIFIIYDIGLYLSLAFAALFGIGLFSIYKARIEIDEKEIYGPFFPWYENYIVDNEEVPMFKTILFTNIKSIRLVDVTHATGEVAKAIFLEIRNKYNVVLLLDGFSVEKQQEIWSLLSQKHGI